MAAKNRLEEYREKKAAKQTTGQQDSGQQSQTKKNRLEEYREKRGSNSENIYAVASSITERVNTWLQNHNNYIKNYQTRNAGRKYSYEDSYVSDSGSWLDTVSKQKSAFDAEADSILAYMDQFNGYLDADWMKSVRDTLTGARGQQNIVLENTTKDNEWWNGFGSDQELVNQFGSAEGVYNYFQRTDGYNKKYTGMSGDDIQKAITTLQEGEERDWLLYNQGDVFGNTIRSNADFQKYASQGAALDYTDFGTEEWHRGKSRRQRGYNSIDKYRAASLALSEHYGNDAPLGSQGQYDGQVAIYRTMEDEEFETLAYCIAYDKEHGTNLAEQYVDRIEMTLTNRRGTNIANKIKDIPVVADLYAIPAGLDQFATGLENLIYDKDYYIPSEIQVASGEIRESFADDGFKLPDWMGGASVRQGLYDLGTTTFNMAPSILASYAANALLPGSGAIVGNALMGASAAGNAYGDAINRGFGKDEAKFYAGAIGASEAVLGAALGGISKLGGVSPALTKAVSGIDSGLARFALKYGGKLVSEGVEEGLQEILDPILQNAIIRADEDIDWSQVAYSALLGAMSAGVLETRVTINETRAETALNNQTVKQYGEHTDALIQEGLQSDQKSESYKLAQKYQQQVQGKDGQNGKAMTGYQIRNLLAANQEQITPKDMKMIQQAAEKRLTELGQSEDVAKVAELATKYATGQKLTKAEKNFLSSSKYGSRVYNELLPKNIMSGDFSTEWAEEIGTKQVNRGAYNKKAIVRSIVEAMSKVEDPNAYKSLESRVEAEEPAKVSDTGKAVIRATDEEIDLESPTFKQISDDGVTLEVNGKAVNANDIDYESADQGLAINAISKIEHITPAAATALYGKLDMAKPVMEQLNGMDEAFSYGYYNYSEADLEAGEFAGSLTQEQKTDAYKLGQYVAKNTVTDNVAAIKKMRTAADAAVEKAKAEGKEVPNGKKLSITYNHGGGVIEDIATARKKLGKLTDEQLGGMEAAEILHQMGIGTDFELFTSYYSKTLKDKKGKPLEVFLNDEGQEQAAYAGIYMAANGKIRINLNAYSGTKGLTLNALSHELTHFIKTWSPEKYKAMAEFLVKSYGEKGVSMHKLVLKEQARLTEIRGEAVSYGEAYDEVVANAFNRMLEDGKVMERIAEIRQMDKSLGDKIVACIRNFIKRFFKVYQKNQSLFMETEALMEMKEVFEQLQAMFAEALVDASDNFQASLIAKEAGLDVMPVEASTQYSYQSLAEAAGFNAVENEDGTRSFVRDGKKVNEVTVADIDNSPIGAFINFSVEMKDISEADAKRQKEMFAKLCTMACKTNDFAMTMQFVGSAVFTGMKANADKQYGTTYDFPSICTKTQAVIDAMSAKMMALGRGLNTDEIVKLYDDVFASGNPVPCPECYVFSRWIGIGGLLDNIKKYQDYYGDMDIKDVAAAYLKMKAEVSKFADEQGISFGKAKGALTSKLTKEYNKLTEKIEKAQNQGEKVKPADQQRLAELEPMMNTVKSMTWLENVYFADSSLKKVNPNFRVPNNVLFDLNNGEAFATKYKEAWAFRTTQGAGYGKAITPYAEARLGEGVLVTNNTTNAIKGRAQGTLDNYFLQQMGKLDKKSRDALKRARIKQKIQAFIGGQRFQSTSDARYENASDYLLAALEMQAMGGMVQCYTKVDGAVPAFSAWGFSINQSLMPLGGGLDADGNVKDTAVGGMKPSVAFENRKNHETAGTITIGVNDNHIRAMFKQLVRDFIIPYHASGGKAAVVAEFRRIQEGKEEKGEAVRSTDYSRTQSDKILSDEVLRWQGKTDAQIQRIHEIRDARIAILTGGKVNMTVVRSNRFLSALYDKLNGGEWDGVKLAKSKVESQIYPNEFWDQTVSYDESAKITKDYLEYCEDLGFLHRFSGMIPSNGKLVPASGYNENGERVQLTDLAYKYDENGNKTTEVEEFFWKVLTDRRMYDNSGNYLPQKVVTLNDTTAETVTGFAKNNQGRQYDKAKAEALAKKIAGEQYSSQETDLDTDADSTYDGIGLNDIKYAVRKGTGIKWNNGNAIQLERKEFAAVTSRISTEYKRRKNHGGVQYIERSTDGKDAKLYLYLFVDHGFDNYEIIARLDYSKQDELIDELRRMIQNGRETERVSTGSGRLRTFYGNSARSGNSSQNGGIQNADDKKNSGSRGQRSKDYGRICSADSNGSDERGNSTGGVKGQFSSQQTDLDSMGNKLTEDQLEYFEKSMARDRNGNLQVVYHGGTVKFEFDTARGAAGKTEYGPGAYFTESDFIAKQYSWARGGNVKEYYLNIERMFDDTDMAKTVQLPQWQKLEQILHRNGIEEKYIQQFREYGFGYMRRYLAIKAGDRSADNWAGSEQMNAMLREAGFDGVKGPINDSIQYVIFTPNQAKLTTNEVPSAFYDTRYSTQETDNITDRDMLANAFETISRSSAEYEMIQDYKSNVDQLNKLERELSDVKREIRDIRFGTGKWDAEKVKLLEDKAKQLAEEVTKYDKRLLNMEASAPLRNVIQQERKKEAERTKAHIKQIQQNKKLRAEQTELRHKIRKAVRDLDKILNRGSKKQNVKQDMQDFVSKALELADYIFTDHVSNDELIRKGITVRMTPKEAALVRETEDILSQLYDNADSLSDDEFTRLDAKRKANLDKLRDLLTAQRNERLNTPVSKLFDDLVNAYASLKNSKQDAVKAAYNEELEKSLRAFMGDDERVKILSNMRVADMTTEELNWLYRAYTMVLTNVRKANEFHVKGMNATIDQMAGRIANDFSSRKIPDKKLAIAVQKLVNKMGWDYEKLYYALDRIGSEAFAELIMNIADSENTVMQDIMEAAAFRDQMVKNYGYNNWAVNKEIDREFLDNTGKKFKLTLGQLMALYAYSRREGALDHLEYGGFMFGEAALTNPRPADTYKINKAQCDAITSLLTAEQKAYAEDMQKFLSETMGEKGNEVSMLLYGIKMFGEKNYFPIHVAGQFKAQAQESQAKAAAGFGSMSNAGFTHEQNRKAKAPIVLEGFNEIWTDHVNEMSRYHGTVPALEDLRRVMNRSAYSDSMSDSTSIAQLMENSYGKEARAYFDNLYREANSGAITDKLQHTSKKLLSLFRKNSVAYSLSVLIQQPASLVRAYAMIDRKYFGFKGFGAITSGVAKAVTSRWNSAYADAYNEMLKYAPGVTMAKEIGGFDTATGGSIRSYLLDTNKSIGQKWKTGTAMEKAGAVMGVVDDNAIANLPNVADKIAWIEIWNACKRETVAKHKDLTPGSDAFMEAVGERFTEVIRATQVYDSIFAKSPMLKSKNLAVQYLVSFMNEPNTVANMAEKAVRDIAKGDWKQGTRTAHVLIHSIIFTGVMKSIVYAMRDDDEDESYIEKYIESLVGGLIDDFNPFNYIPIARDVVSLAQGYDVERADMAIVADAIDAVEKVIKYMTTDTEDMTEEQLIELDKKQIDAWWKLAESLAAFAGIPVKNIRREINGVLDHARIAQANAGQTTKKSISDKVYDAVAESIPFMSSNKKSKTDKLYEAIMSGDQAYLGRLKSGYKDDDAYHSAVRKVLRENDTRIHEAAQAKYEGNSTEYKRIFREIQNEGKFSFDDIMEAINSELSAIKKEIEPKSETSDYSSTDFINAILVGETSVAEAMREDIIASKMANGKTQSEAEESFADSVATGTKNAYYDGLLDEAGVAEILTAYADMDDEEADGKVNYWAFCKAHPQYDLSQTNVEDYWEFGEPAEIPLDIFVQYINGTKGLVTIRDEYGDEVESKRDQVLAVIDSLDLTWQQKDALYLAAGYAESKIWDVPW